MAGKPIKNWSIEMQQRKRMDDLKKQLDQLNGEIFWKEEVIRRSINYAEATKLKKEIEELGKQRVLLVKEIDNRVKQRILIHDRRSMKKIGIFGNGRTKFL